MKLLTNCWHAVVIAAITAIACSVAHAGVTVLGVQYQQDNPYPEFQCIWHDRNYPI